MRPLAAALSLGLRDVILTGEPRMKERPIAHLVTALRQGGAQVDYLESDGYPPVRLHGGFNGGEISVDGSVSSQFLTALLMAAPMAAEETRITILGELVSKPYIAITLAMMRAFGVEVENHAYRHFVVRGGRSIRLRATIWSKEMHPRRRTFWPAQRSPAVPSG